MHNLIAGVSVSRISRQSGHALPQHRMPSAWNRTLSIGLSPAGVYSVFAKVTVCMPAVRLHMACRQTVTLANTEYTSAGLQCRGVLFQAEANVEAKWDPAELG